MKRTKARLSYPGIFWIVVAALPLCTSCGKKSGDSSPCSPSANAAGKKGPVIDGEHFTTRVVQDAVQKLPLGVFAAPEKWKDTS